MKKIMLIAAVVFATIAANAASTKWTFVASKMTGADLTTAYAGAVTVYVSGGDLSETITLTSGTAVNGGFSKANFTVDTLTAGQTYNFWYVLTDTKGGVEYTLTSSTKTVNAVATGTGMLTYGDQSGYTKTAGNWVAAPEPTSALLMLLGMAGLALKRKRA